VTSGEVRRTRQNRRATVVGACAIAALASYAGVASGNVGGVGAPAPPSVDDTRCLERCLNVRTVTETGIAELTGKDLDEIKNVRLDGPDGKLRVKPRTVRSERVEFRVPRGTRSGRPAVIDRYGNKARSPERLKVEPEDSIEQVSGFSVRRAEANPRKSFFDGKRRSQFSYMFEADGPADVRIDVLKGKKRKLVDSFVRRDQKPFATNTTRWNGLGKDKKVAPSGKYKFEVRPLSGGEPGRAGFRYYDHIFPVRGNHTYGDGLGAGRNHQGQDVFANCGAKIVAARGGKVKVRSYHSAAGYYIVIAGRKTGRDYAYMHLQKRGRVKQGAKVRTGEVIGYNGETGNASGCHLHFEMWSAPGWYEGGRPINPTKHLKRWDRWS
jgi:murein DD-endopeptidase MepM/ murein hydrolase activator NlpD